MQKPEVILWKLGTGRGWVTVGMSHKSRASMARDARKRGWKLMIRSAPNNVEDELKGVKNVGRKDFIALGKRLGSDKRVRDIYDAYPDCPEIWFCCNNEGDKAPNGTRKPNISWRTAMVEAFIKAIEQSCPKWRGKVHYVPYDNYAFRNRGATDMGRMWSAYKSDQHRFAGWKPRAGKKDIPIFGAWDIKRPHQTTLPTKTYLAKCLTEIRRHKFPVVAWFDLSNAKPPYNQGHLYDALDAAKWDQSTPKKDPKPKPPPRKPSEVEQAKAKLKQARDLVNAALRDLG